MPQKKRHAVADAVFGHEGEIRHLDAIDNGAADRRAMIKKLAARYQKLYFCCKAAPTG
jgi:transposase